MMKISTKIMATTTLIMSTIMVLSSENWMSMWMGLEINMLSFIPLMEKSKNYKSSESKMMYFLIQSMSSMTFLFIIVMSPTMFTNEMIMEKTMSTMIMMTMMMKMGIAPMHMWFINIINKMSWNSCMILMTWQKIAPMTVLSNMSINNMIMNLCILSSTIIGAISGVNQTSIQKIMAFSSVNHLGWMLMCLKSNNEMWIKYIMIYSIIIIMMTSMFQKKSINYINQMNFNSNNNMEKMNIMMLFLSLGGLPPFIGFLPKWMVIQSMIDQESMFTMMIMMFMSMITLFYYIRMMSPTIMKFNIKNKWNMKNYNKKNIDISKMIINLILPMVVMMNLI